MTLKVSADRDHVEIGRNLTFSGTTGSIVGSGGTGNLSLTTGLIDQVLLLVQVRPNVASNTFEVKIYSDAARTKLVYWVDQITLNEWVAEENVPLPLPNGIAYLTFINNAASSRVFSVSLTVGERD